VDRAGNSAKSGDYVLLSPMCSSFDMFDSYEDRGRVFKKLVLEKNKMKV
jgi:UDP-N-acetylmuramoylalanine--D-glutamate ligase